MSDHLAPTRRTVTRGAVWSVPVVAVAATAPAFAASPCACVDFSVPAFPSTGTAGNGWAITATGGTSGGGSDTFSGGSFVTVADPTSTATRTVSAVRTVCVTAGQTYRFSWSWTAFTANARPMTSVLQVGGLTLATSLVDTAVSARSGTRVATWVATTSGDVSLAFVHTTSPSGGTTVADDITINNLVGTCA